MANEQNLKPIRTESEAREKGRNGGIASGESRRARKTLRSDLEDLLSRQAKDKKGNELGYNVQTGIAIALINKAAKGDTKAFEIIRDTIGEKPAEKVMLAEIDQKTIEEVEKMVTGRDA